jgi:hypothetical protein
MAVTGLSPAALIVGANAMRTAIKGAQMHTGDPGVGGAANKSSAAMAVPAWAVVDAAGIWYGNVQLTGDLTFDSNGAYTVETLPIAGTSS